MVRRQAGKELSLGQVMKNWIGRMGEGQKTGPSSMGAGRDGVNGWVRR